MKKGYIHVYTGNGKGKTTAAIGIAIRSAGAGLRVFFGQFVKDMVYSEIKILKQLSEHITVRQYGQGCFFDRKPQPQDIESAKNGLADIETILASGEYDMVILDEANIAVHFGLFNVRELLDVITKRNSVCEVIVTGRYAADELIEAADLVTEMREIKHYYTNGVKARKGVER